METQKEKAERLYWDILDLVKKAKADGLENEKFIQTAIEAAATQAYRM